MIKLIGIDVDGTLVGSSGIVPPAVWSAAERARKSGIHLALCSGRPAFGAALDYARRLDVTGWHVFQNGASILDLGTGQSRSAPLSMPLVRTFIEQARRTGEVLELYSDDKYVIESTSAWAREHAELLGIPFHAAPFESLTEPIVRVQWLLTPEATVPVMAQPHPGLEISQSTSPLMPHTRFVALTREGVSKGSAITAIAAAYDIPLADVMYVGDAGNDLPALRVVGHPVAMANSDPAVLAVATRTVGDVNEAGVAQALEIAIASRGR